MPEEADVPFPDSPRDRWFAFTEAARPLGVTPRAIKRWMRLPARRQALLAVRHGKQWRIPHPTNVDLWERETRARLHAVGVSLKPAWEPALVRLARKNAPYWVETQRLYLAASAKPLLRGRITPKTKEAIDELCQKALEILRHKKQRFGLEEHKRSFPRRLWRYWPKPEHFASVCDANTRKSIEKQRRRLDFLRALRAIRRRGKEPTAENLRPLLHLDWLADINDTKEKLPPGTIDFRQPQPGISRREFRRRYPLKKACWRGIIAQVYGVRATIPSSEERQETGLNPKRGPKDY